MLVYQAIKREFIDSVERGSIIDEIYDVYKQKIDKSLDFNNYWII